MSIRQLPEGLVNRIAAGEVIERPSSAVKELVENAIDASASQIDIAIQQGGKDLIEVVDNGRGMSRDDLELCVERHATSKLPDDDLLAISFLGFRGEALPSIGSVSRLTISSRQKDADSGWQVQVTGGDKHGAKVAAGRVGTRVEVADLFYATPARLKFLKSERAESAAITDIVKRLAMAIRQWDFPSSPMGATASQCRHPTVICLMPAGTAWGPSWAGNFRKMPWPSKRSGTASN